MNKSKLELKKADDLFEKSSMSFGDHLEELRRALVKSSLWLCAGLAIGLPMATSVVRYMQTPLEAALIDFYMDGNIAELEKSTGQRVPDDLKAWMLKNKKIGQIVFRDRAREESVRSSELSDEALANADHAGHPDPKNLVAYRDFVGVKASTEALGLQEPFLIWFKAALVVAVIVASPGIFFHIWEFVSSGLYPHERRYVYFFLPVSLILFWSGACLAFFVIFRLVINFLLEFNSSMGIGASPRLTDYMSFALLLPLGFGISFQLPLVMLILERLGIFTVQVYLSQWRMAVLVIAFISMVLTPADVSSMLGMAIPLIGLYFVGIAMCRYLPKSTMLRGEARDPT
jgi:sec-independent protein translocase protein TatC